jgi:hypothetical protein
MLAFYLLGNGKLHKVLTNIEEGFRPPEPRTLWGRVALSKTELRHYRIAHYCKSAAKFILLLVVSLTISLPGGFLVTRIIHPLAVNAFLSVDVEAQGKSFCEWSYTYYAMTPANLDAARAMVLYMSQRVKRDSLPGFLDEWASPEVAPASITDPETGTSYYVSRTPVGVWQLVRMDGTPLAQSFSEVRKEHSKITCDAWLGQNEGRV